tara:strand:- start:1631 stop:2188 length:558 start_codon:yes stop_codon:yes gene_type:complete
MDYKKIEALLNIYATNVIKEAKENLKSKKKSSSGKLYNSLSAKVTPLKDYILLQFSMEDYGIFVDKGVKGKNPNALPKNAKWKGIQKAPNSPYQFGKGGTGLRAAINKWTVQKNVFNKQIRNKKGQFIPRKSLQFMMSRSIYLAGIEATQFFSNPFNQGLKTLGDKLLKAFELDVEKNIILGDKK